MKKNILLIGSEGFIGNALKEKLNTERYGVIPYDISLGQDMLDREHLLNSMRSGVDEVILMAAQADLNKAKEFPYQAMQLNVQAVIEIAHICFIHNKPLTFISTCCVYGDQATYPATEKSYPNPSEIYTHTKMAAEHIVKGYGFLGLKYKIARIPTTYGEGMRKELGVAIFFEQALKEEPITIHGHGYQTRELTYISDTVDGIYAVMEKGKNGETYNVTAKEQISAIDMADIIKAITKSNSEIKHIQQREGQFYIEDISHDKLTRDTGWEPKVSFIKGIEKTYDWYKEKNK